jgi:hypothetical protein
MMQVMISVRLMTHAHAIRGTNQLGYAGGKITGRKSAKINCCTAMPVKPIAKKARHNLFRFSMQVYIGLPKDIEEKFKN